MSKYFKNKDERVFAGSKSLLMFAIIYFPHYFKNKSAPFHKDMCRLYDSLNAEQFKYLLNIAFRESAKTTFAKIDFIRNIVYGWSKMMFYTSFEQDIAENNLLDIALELQTNKFILNDFGQLYFDESGEKKSKKSGVGNFLTKNKVRVQASTVRKTLRGQIFNAERPDYIILDDIENDTTKNSTAKTRITINFIEEMMTGLAPNAKAIILGNRISDSGVIANCEERFRDNPQARIFEKALIENGVIQWDRFTWDWIKQQKRTLNIGGKKRFEQEYLNQPIVDGDRIFDVDIIDSMVDSARSKEFTTRGNWKIWQEPQIDRFEGEHEYMVGIDISQGFGLDSSTIEVIDRTTGEQVAEYESNQCSPNDLVDQILWAYEEYYYPIICPENNSIGQAVIAILKERGMQHILYVEEKIDTITHVKTNRYGWNTNAKTKPKMIFDLVEGIKTKDIIINSVLALKEIRGFSNRDVDHSSFDSETSKHYDRVMGLAIAWQMRNKANSFRIVNSKDLFAHVDYGSEIHNGGIIDRTLEENFIVKKYGQRLR